ncbi:MAG: L-threonate dehydrogenase [Burkholderiaceae bacterium]
MNQAKKKESESPVGVIGLGSMGFGVASSLLKAGFSVIGCDVRDDVLDRFSKLGGISVRTPAELAQKVSALIVLVVDAAQTDTVLFGENGAAAAMQAGGVIIRSSTVSPDYASRLSARLRAMGLRNIDAPISGGAIKAAAGELSVMASGSPQDFDQCQPIFDAIAANLYRLGDQPGQGSTAKMINQLLAGVHIAASAEAMALGIRSGADPEALYEVICNSAGSSWMFQNRVPHILEGDYTPHSAVNIFIKDLGIVLDSARQAHFPLPLSAAAHQMFLMAAAAGHGAEDDSAVIKIFPAINLPTKKNK